MNSKERFLNLCMETHRPGMKGLLAWLETTDFFECPASSRYHGSHAGGLLEHSLNVYDEFRRLQSVFPSVNAPNDSVIIAALFHDLCKVNFYVTEQRNRKVDGRWETYEAYSIKEKFPFGGHGSKSVFLAQNFIKLTPEEAVAINCHMGINGENANSISSVYEAYPFAWLLHVADEAAAFIDEAEKESKKG